MTKYLLITLFFSMILVGMSQTATDFTADDCNGVSHNLFSELESGKVIVICWVMPCGPCAGPALTAKNIVQSFQTAHPNTVYYYLVDDYGSTPCAYIDSWGNSNSIPESSWSKRFSNSAINMNDYNGEGMPKVVVLGGYNHTVFYDANNTVNSTLLQEAVANAIEVIDINEVNANSSEISIFPNPAKDNTILKFELSKVSEIKIELFNLQGQKLNTVFSGQLLSGENQIKMDIKSYKSGMYMIKLTEGLNFQFRNLLIQ